MLPRLQNVRKSAILGTALLLLGSVPAFANTPEEISRQALDMAGNQEFSQALDYIGQQSPDAQNTYDVRFTRARILAWSGQHEKSELAYKGLLRDYPGNPDIENGYGYLEYYRGNFDNAERILGNVLLAYPEYDDARTGLERIRAAKADVRNSSPNWRIDMYGEVSSFNNGMPDWNEQNLRAEYGAGSIAVHGRVTRYERFGLNDIQLGAGIRSNNRNQDWDWEIGAGFTPSADFRPETSINGRVGYKTDLGGGTVLHSSVGYQIDDYELAGNIHQLSPQMMAYLSNGMIFTGRVIHVMQDGVSDQTGFLVSSVVPVTDEMNVRLGYANAPEAVNGLVIDTESLFGGLSYSLTDELEIHGTYTRDDRENTYIRDGFNVGLTQRY